MPGPPMGNHVEDVHDTLFFFPDDRVPTTKTVLVRKGLQGIQSALRRVGMAASSILGVVFRTFELDCTP